MLELMIATSLQDNCLQKFIKQCGFNYLFLLYGPMLAWPFPSSGQRCSS